MRRRFVLILLALLSYPAAGSTAFPVLTYHDVTATRGTDPYAVTVAAFREQMAFLRAHGYQTLSLRQLAAIEAGRAALPARAVMITFDDGLASFVEQVLPVLDEHRLHAVLSVTTAWLDGRNRPPEYAGRIMNWEQLRRCARSPWVEILTHSDNLHHGVPADRQGDLGAASVTRRFDAARGRYESEPDFRRRIGADLERSLRRLHRETGRRPDGIAWPYGLYDAATLDVAGRLGLRWQLTLGEGPTRLAELPRVTRRLVRGTDSLAAFERLLEPDPVSPPRRIAAVDLDDMPATGHEAQERWLSALLDRLQLLRVNTVLVSPFTADGRSGYFQAPELPVRADVLYRVLHRLRTRLEIDQIVLRLAAVPVNDAVIDELARRHPYRALVLGAAVTPTDAARLVARFRRQHLDLRCGIEGDLPVAGCTDFRLHWIDGSRAARPAPSDYAVVSLASAEQTVRALQAVRAGGGRDYGVTDGPALADAASLQRVAVELSRHVIGDAGGRP